MDTQAKITEDIIRKIGEAGIKVLEAAQLYTDNHLKLDSDHRQQIHQEFMDLWKDIDGLYEVVNTYYRSD